MERKNIKLIFLFIVLALFVSYPIYNDYLVWQHDLPFHLIRIENISKAIEDLQIPIRIHSLDNFGYGYATPLLYPELFLLIPGLLKFFGMSLISSYKIFLIFINFVSVLCMYICVKKLSKSTTAGMISGIVYASATYRLETVFTRGSVGEALAMAFFPLAIWGLYELVLGDKKKWYIFAIGVSCIIQSHIISIIFALAICLITGISCLKSIIKEKRFIEIIISIITMILLNLWFIGPFMHIYRTVELHVSSDEFYETYFESSVVIPAQLFNFFSSSSSELGSTFVENGMHNEMSYTLGLICMIGLVISVIYCYQNRKNSESLIKFIKILTVIGMIFLIGCTSIVPWGRIINHSELIKMFTERIQFPWRFLGVSTLTITITMSIIIGKYIDSKYDKDKDFIENYKTVIEIAIVSLALVPMFLANYSNQEIYMTKESELNYSMSLYPEYFVKGTAVSELVPENYVSSEGIEIKGYQKDSSNITLSYVNSIGKGYIEVPLLYYPVYTARDNNGNRLTIEAGNNNVIRVLLTEETEGTIKIDRYDRDWYLACDIVSLLSFIAFSSYIMVRNKKDKKSKLI